MHNDFVRPGGQWPPETVPNQADYQRWDVLQFKSVNGDLGGAWNPTQPIIFGGSGVALSGSGTLTGGCQTLTGGRFLLQANDAPILSPNRSRTVFVPVERCGVTVDVNSVSGAPLREDYYIQPVFGLKQAGVYVKNAPAAAFIDIPRRYVQTLARIATISLTFTITTKPSSIPTAMQLFPAAILGATGGQQALNPQPGSIPQWFHGTSHALNSYINPSSQGTNRGYYYKATSISGTGTSGSVEPTWPTVIGNTVTDNPGADQIVWTCTGRNGWLSTFGATVDSYWANGAAQTLSFDTDGSGSNILGNFFQNTANSGTASYQLQIVNPDPNALLTGVLISYDTIASLAFE